jgi:hypothetical protein
VVVVTNRGVAAVVAVSVCVFAFVNRMGHALTVRSEPPIAKQVTTGPILVSAAITRDERARTAVANFRRRPARPVRA